METGQTNPGVCSLNDSPLCVTLPGSRLHSVTPKFTSHPVEPWSISEEELPEGPTVPIAASKGDPHAFLYQLPPEEEGEEKTGVCQPRQMVCRLFWGWEEGDFCWLTKNKGKRLERSVA